jgi:hypothetical protein
MLRIDWEETSGKLRQAGFMEEEMEEVRKDPVAGIAKYLDKERRLPLCFRGKGLTFEIAGEKTLEVILKQE